MHPDLTTWLTYRELVDRLTQRLPNTNITRYSINQALEKLGCAPRVKPTDQKTYLYAPEWIEAIIAWMRSGVITPNLPFAQP